MTKITELPEIVVLADDDYLTAVDVSDMSESPTGKNVKIQKQNLLAGMVVKEEINRITDPGVSGFDFTGLDLTGYDRLIVSGWLRSDIAGDLEGLYCHINGDTTEANYFRQEHAALNGANSSLDQDGISSGLFASGSASADRYSDVDLVINNPSGVSTKLMACSNRIYRSAANAIIGEWLVFHKTDTAPVTQLTFTGEQGGAMSGALILYGERTI